MCELNWLEKSFIKKESADGIENKFCQRKKQEMGKNL